MEMCCKRSKGAAARVAQVHHNGVRGALISKGAGE